MMTVLICDDDREIASAIQVYLQGEGYHTLLAYNGKEALALLKEHTVHCIVMDIMMPEMDGIEATMKIRQEKNIPILMLSAKSEDVDKILGLNIGADDYLTKPFNPLELIARVKSQTRRYTHLGSMEKKEKNPDSLQTGGICLDNKRKQVLVDGDPVHLTPIEFKILHLLMSHLDQVFSIEQIYEQVWQEDAFGADNTVAVHIRRIREKIEINPKEPRYLKVVWGLGYKMENVDISSPN